MWKMRARTQFSKMSNDAIHLSPVDLYEPNDGMAHHTKIAEATKSNKYLNMRRYVLRLLAVWAKILHHFVSKWSSHRAMVRVDTSFRLMSFTAGWVVRGRALFNIPGKYGSQKGETKKVKKKKREREERRDADELWASAMSEPQPQPKQKSPTWLIMWTCKPQLSIHHPPKNQEAAKPDHEYKQWRSKNIPREVVGQVECRYSATCT